jgi:hypothetical protein
MKRSLLLWVDMSLLRGVLQRQVIGLVHHSYPLNAGLCQVAFSLGEDEWSIGAEGGLGEVVLVNSSDSSTWNASLMLWVPMVLTKNDPSIAMGLTHCVNPLCPCMGHVSFPLDDWKIESCQLNGQATLHSRSNSPRTLRKKAG